MDFEQFVLANEPAIRLSFFLGIFLVVGLWEVAAPRRALTVSKAFRALYRAVLHRNTDSAGREVLESIVAEEEKHLGELEGELETIQRQERGLSDVPMFLHFNRAELERLVPDLSRYRRDGELRLDPRAVMELAMTLEQNAAAFFKEYSEKFMETLGKRIFQRFADAEMRHFELISRRLEAFLAVPT